MAMSELMILPLNSSRCSQNGRCLGFFSTVAVVGNIPAGLLEFLDGLAERLADLRQTLCPEQNQDNQKDNDQLAHANIKHIASLDEGYFIPNDFRKQG